MTGPPVEWDGSPQKSGVTIMVRVKNIQIGHMHTPELIIGKWIKGIMGLKLFLDVRGMAM